MSSLQDVIALSMTEAEYIVATESFKEAKWLKGLIGELYWSLSWVCVYCDSQSAIHLSKNHNMFYRRIGYKYNFICDEI